jgi:hypothetical protein
MLTKPDDGEFSQQIFRPLNIQLDYLLLKLRN